MLAQLLFELDLDRPKAEVRAAIDYVAFYFTLFHEEFGVA